MYELLPVAAAAAAVDDVVAVDEPPVVAFGADIVDIAAASVIAVVGNVEHGLPSGLQSFQIVGARQAVGFPILDFGALL